MEVSLETASVWLKDQWSATMVLEIGAWGAAATATRSTTRVEGRSRRDVAKRGWFARADIP